MDLFRLFVLSITLVYAASVAAGSRVITVAGDDWCPVNCSEKSVDKGFMIDAATQILALEGYTVNYIEMPWTRAIKLARDGEIDAVVGAFEGDAPDFVFSNSPLLYLSPNSLFVKSDTEWEYNGISSLNDVRLGVISGYDYGAVMNDYIRSRLFYDNNRMIQVFGDNATKRNIDLLRLGRVDVIVENAIVFWYQVADDGDANRFREVSTGDSPKACHIAFSPVIKDANELVNAFDRGYHRLQQQQTLQSIAEKYSIDKKYLSPAYQ
ncbi:substrate-binding periplasmic protein [Alteromonas oceanisediminis]|uniref:substrate-binding periplasmic protein n=1 Tax=Alteromonas oceanisediminis TaxID=2836180 RepID=UPI001BD99577|nr:transporter substrate-binding domain-containing protein [Alteromonas oceanisediminis]